MELRHLRYFIAVAEEQNVTRAAARLHVSQPPLSRQIHDLESELGVALFERTGKSVRLTDAGRLFLDEARAVVLRAEKAVQAVRAVAAGTNGELHLGYAPSPTVGILPAALRAFRKKSPGVRVILHDLSSPEMLAGLRDGKLHAALMVQPSKQAGRGLLFEKLDEFPIVIAIPLGHRLSRRRSVALRDVVGEPIVAFSRKEYPDYHELLARIVGPHLKQLRFAEECDSGTSLIAAVESGKGITFSASFITETAGRRLNYIPLIPAPSPLIVGIAYRKETLTPLAHSFVETIRSVVVPRP
ncbi:MAG: LysR family transcriptional regulator [Verrucomicrobia bacterium]|nr:LysR family transcriptional regulator [Verrucomicrobiota bacterium]